MNSLKQFLQNSRKNIGLLGAVLIGSVFSWYFGLVYVGIPKDPSKIIPLVIFPVFFISMITWMIVSYYFGKVDK